MINLQEDKLAMKKTILILSLLALIANSCGSKKEKTPFDLVTFPSEWRSLTKENGKLAACDSSFEILKIEGNKLIRIYYARGEQSDFESEILASYQIGDTIVISTKPTNEEFVWEYKFLWLDKNKGLAEWIFNNESNAEAFIVNERVAEYQTEKVEKQQTKKKVKYYYINNDHNETVVFFDDGTAYQSSNREVKIDAAGYVVLDESLTERTWEGAPYRVFPDALIIGKIERFEFFNEIGNIIPNWIIINYHEVSLPMQITNFETKIKKNEKSDIQEITETCLIFITPETGYDKNNTALFYEKMGIQAIEPQTQYLSFVLNSGEKIVIDIAKKQNGKTYKALLYRTGQIPLVVSISGESEEGIEIIEEYLRESGDGMP